jgi:hypothetical protein
MWDCGGLELGDGSIWSVEELGVKVRRRERKTGDTSVLVNADASAAEAILSGSTADVPLMSSIALLEEH